jgi:hypothetical protein
MSLPRIFVDFQNADVSGRVRLNCAGSMRDLMEGRVDLKPGLKLLVYSDDGDEFDLQADGVVEYSDDEHCWVAVINWHDLKQVARPLPAVIAPAANEVAQNPTQMPNPSVR